MCGDVPGVIGAVGGGVDRPSKYSDYTVHSQPFHLL